MKNFAKCILISYIIVMLFAWNYNFMVWTDQERAICVIFGFILFVMD